MTPVTRKKNADPEWVDCVEVFIAFSVAMFLSSTFINFHQPGANRPFSPVGLFETASAREN